MADSKLWRPDTSRRGKRSVPLTPSNVMGAVEQVRHWWREEGVWSLTERLFIPQSKADEIKRNFPDVMEQKKQMISYWINTDPLAGWRRLITALDGMRETQLADLIRSNAEPLTDATLTPRAVSLAVSTVRDFWGGGLLYWLGVSYPVDGQIRASQLYASEDEKRMAGLQYYLQTVPGASWGRIAGVLWYIKEQTALETVRQYLPHKPDPSLTPFNLTLALQSLPDKEWNWFGIRLNFPHSTLDKIQSQFHSDEERKAEVIRVYLIEHPHPTWEHVSDVLYQEGYHSVLERLQSLFPTVPVIRGANILKIMKVQITPGQPIKCRWDGTGFEIYVPGGAISTAESEHGPVTMSIQASLSGEYELPDDRVFVSGVYWIALSPPVKFAEKVTISIQHCASETDSTLSFVTAKCTQKNLPYKFKELPDGSFATPFVGCIEVDNFSAFGIVGSKVSECALSTYYIPKEHNNIWEARIAVTPNLKLPLERVRQHFKEELKGEEGPTALAKFDGSEISLIIPGTGVPQKPWDTNGWELYAVVFPTLQRQSVTKYKGFTTIPSFIIQMKLSIHSEPQSLVQRVMFEGLKPSQLYLTITREPQHQGHQPPVLVVPTPLPATRAQPPTATTDEQQAERTLDISNLADILLDIHHVAPKWKDVGLLLRLHPSELELIEANHAKEGVTSCLRVVVDKWLKRSYDTATHGQPSWPMLVDAIAHPVGGNNPALAEQIATKHQLPPLS